MGFIQQLGVEIVKVHTDGVTVECAITKELLNSHGVLHGGVTASVADTAMGIAVSRRYDQNQLVTTVELKINYLRPVVEGKILARSRIIRAGHRICVGQVDVFDATKKKIAIALMTFFVEQSSSE